MMVQGTKRITVRITQVLFCLSLVSLQACSAKLPDASQDPNHIRHAIASQYPEGERVFNVKVPTGYADNPDHIYPVLFHLAFDREALEWTQGVVQELSTDGRIPEMIIVSLHHSRRNRADIRPAIEDDGGAGQADRFLEHIKKEVMPLLVKQYRISDDRILAGWSRFGTFTTFAMTQKPDLFTGYIVSSSAGLVSHDVLFSKVQNLLSQTPGLSASFHTSIGTEGNEGRRREAFNSLESLLYQDAPPSLRWRAEVIEGAGHSETFQSGLRSGLLFHFSK